MWNALPPKPDVFDFEKNVFLILLFIYLRQNWWLKLRTSQLPKSINIVKNQENSGLGSIDAAWPGMAFRENSGVPFGWSILTENKDLANSETIANYLMVKTRALRIFYCCWTYWCQIVVALIFDFKMLARWPLFWH